VKHLFDFSNPRNINRGFSWVDCPLSPFPELSKIWKETAVYKKKKKKEEKRYFQTISKEEYLQQEQKRFEAFKAEQKAQPPKVVPPVDALWIR